LINREYMRQYHANDSAIVNRSRSAIGGGFDTPAYFTKTLYYVGVNDTLKAFAITNAHIGATPIGQSGFSFGFRARTPTVSANGTNNGIVWALTTSAYAQRPRPCCTPSTPPTWPRNCTTAARSRTRDAPGGAVKFAVPTVANGKCMWARNIRCRCTVRQPFLAAPAIVPVARFSPFHFRDHHECLRGHGEF